MRSGPANFPLAHARLPVGARGDGVHRRSRRHGPPYPPPVLRAPRSHLRCSNSFPFGNVVLHTFGVQTPFPSGTSFFTPSVFKLLSLRERRSSHLRCSNSFPFGNVVLHTFGVQTPFPSGTSFFTPSVFKLLSLRERRSSHLRCSNSFPFGNVVLHT